MVNRDATDQLLASDAVDQSVSRIDFRDLAGQKVFLDSTYIKSVKSVGFVNADYIVSSLRQQLVAADCRIQESKEQADFILEARVGALGADRHDIVWGFPANNLLGTVATAVPTAPAVPPIPEIAFAKKTDELAVAKIGVFAYHRETGQPVWQSGVEHSKSTALSSTVFGIGPFQSGSIYEGTQFAGSKLALPLLGEETHETRAPAVPYASEVHFLKDRKNNLLAEDKKEQPSELEPVPADKPATEAEPASEVKQVSGKKPEWQPTKESATEPVKDKLADEAKPAQ